MRFFVLSAAALTMLSAPAFAHPEHTEASKPSAEIKLPSKAEIEKAIDEMPDLNAILGDLITLANKSDLPKRMERTGETLKKDLNVSGALGPDRNGLPDIKLTLKILANVLSDEDVTEGLSETMAGLQTIMEKHMKESQSETDELAQPE